MEVKSILPTMVGQPINVEGVVFSDWEGDILKVSDSAGAVLLSIPGWVAVKPVEVATEVEPVAPVKRGRKKDVVA